MPLRLPCRLHGSAGALISIGLLKSVDLGFLQLCLQSLKESAGGAHLQSASGACSALLCSLATTSSLDRLTCSVAFLRFMGSSEGCCCMLGSSNSGEA